MTFKIHGIPQLKARVNAIKPNPGLMRDLALIVTAEAKREAPRRTGNLARSIQIGSVSATRAEVRATANYAAFVEMGTRAHIIRPRQRKALRWAPRGQTRLSGTPKKGAQAIFAKRVNHPGTRAHPFMAPAIRVAARAAGLMAHIVKAWNDAA